jgi:predicted regulator of Ras-like GTPase activity (Roadblock/LC7/MglB family)
MLLRSLPLAVVAALAVPVLAQSNVTPANTPAVQKKVVTSADQLPRRQYPITRLPSELLAAPKSELMAAAEALDRDLANDLATMDIQDRATRTGMINTRAQIAIFKGDFAAAKAHLADIRAQQEKAADKLTSGTTMTQILDARMVGGAPEQQRAMVKAGLSRAYGAMPWDVVSENVKGAKSGLEVLSKDVVLGSIKATVDPAAKNLNLNVPAQIVGALVGIHNTFEHVLPFRDDVVAVMQELVSKNQVTRADVWSQRTVALPATAPGKPVVVGIWDSGTDVNLFKPASNPGIAFNAMMLPTPELVRNLGEAQARLPQLKQYVKGSMDLRAALDTPDAQAFKKKMASLKQDEVKQFAEDMGAMGMWVHGTHVAGIAVDGNPFAQVTAVAMHWPHSVVPPVPDEAYVARGAAAFKASVEHFRKTGARVVNMSWRYGPQVYEGMLAYHNIGKTPEERKQRANALFEVERKALEEAIAGAPEILFVAGSGNEDNSADFSQYIPAGFQLPNLITAGAVDTSGTETAFSTFGKTVVVHANGYEVMSQVPGGEKMKLSGTSMASPQVANLAAKLFAMKPELTVAQVKELILKGAEKNGRVNLINPRKTLELAGVKA